MQLLNLICIITQEFNPESPHTRLQQVGNDLCGTLSHRVEQRVPATNVRDQWMIDTRPIPQFDLMKIARSTTVCLVRAR